MLSVLLTVSPASGMLAMSPSSTPAVPSRAAALADPIASTGPASTGPASTGPASPDRDISGTMALLPSRSVPEPGAVLDAATVLASTASTASAAQSAATAQPASTAQPPSTTAAARTATTAPKPTRTRVVAAAKSTSRLWAQLRRGLAVRGPATWYPATRGYAGTAHVAMPGARFVPRGSGSLRARVCAGGRCTVVRVVDACACRAGTSRARVADLSLETLRRLRLDPARGVYTITVTLIRG